MGHFYLGFEEDDGLRSEFIRRLTLSCLNSKWHHEAALDRGADHRLTAEDIPLTLVQFWHDSRQIPSDVQRCLDTWMPLRVAGVDVQLFDDITAANYIANRYGQREAAAFARCKHPAMRSDYFRIAYLLAQGGLYADADDALLTDGWQRMFRGSALKVQPLCYDNDQASMVATTGAGLYDRPSPQRIYYVNNNPIASPPGNASLRRAFARSTEMLLVEEDVHDVQSTTGPGNLTAAIAAQAYEDLLASRSIGLELCFDWELTAKPDWTLGYRGDDRNWRLWRPVSTKQGKRD